MLKYKLKEKPITSSSEHYIEEYLINLGIEHPDRFIDGPRLEDQEDFRHLDNIDRAAELLYKGFKEHKKFFLQVDSDADGYTSGAMFYAFFKRLFPDANIEWRLHDKKEHGIIVETVPIDTDYVIIPDAGSAQIEEQERLNNKGYTVIIMDHHRADCVPKLENVILVNNQTSERCENKALSGAGVVYKTIQCFNLKYENEFPIIFEDYADLAALGIISDMMDIRNLDNNYIIHKGIFHIKNFMFKSFLRKQEYNISDPDIPSKIDLSFYVAPLINAMIRYGTAEEKEKMFKGFITYDLDTDVTFISRGKNKTLEYHDYVALLAGNVRARQNRDKLKAMEFLSNRIETNNLQKEQLLIVKVSKTDKVIVNQSITGLVAMELLKKYNRPTLVLRPKRGDDGGIVYAGSGRGKANGHFTSLFQLLKDSGLCTFVAGHDMAHGVGIKEENIQKVIDYANKELADIKFELNQCEVDYIFNKCSEVNYEMIMQFGCSNHIFGYLIPQPKFAFKLRIPAQAIRIMGKLRNTIKFSVNGVDFIQFRAAKIVEQIEKENCDIFEFDCIGRAQMNEWNQHFTPQIFIDDLNLKPIKRENLF